MNKGKILLVNSTQHAITDDSLEKTISHFEETFPKRIRGYYVDGSFANGSAVATSDVDLLVIFKTSFINEQERELARQIAERCIALSLVELDLEFLDEQSLAVGASPSFKLGSLLLYGEDIRPALPLVPLDVWTRDRMHSSYWRTVNLFQRPPVVHYPLAYPEPTGEFYGYDRRKLRLSDGQEVNCTRDLIRLVGWSATGIIAFKAGKYVARKSDCHKLYQACFADEWGALLQDIYELCRGQWQYLIPIEVEERLLLRTICERTLAFENHFLLIYKEYLLFELANAEIQGILLALWILKQMPYQDAQIKAAILVLEQHEHSEVRSAACAI